VFISGKFLALTVLAVFLLFLKPKKRYVSYAALLILLFALPLVQVMDPVSTYKINQVTSLTNVSKYNMIMSSHTSAGNIISEFDNIFKQRNKYHLIVGKGLGGGISDLNGHLMQFAGTGGYSPLDKLRDNYFKMHLPASEIIVKFGILGFLFYCVFLSRFFLSNMIGIDGVLLMGCLLTVFYISKEYLLLTSLLYVSLKAKDAESSLFK
jgi:multisubunit Na+/H+ antiporter MnhG subunit